MGKREEHTFCWRLYRWQKCTFKYVQPKLAIREMKIEITVRCHYTLSEWLKWKIVITPNVEEDAKEPDNLYFMVRHKIVQPLWKKIVSASVKTKNILIKSSNFTTGYLSQTNETLCSCNNLYSIVILFIIVKDWTRPNVLQWVNA